MVSASVYRQLIKSTYILPLFVMVMIIFHAAIQGKSRHKVVFKKFPGIMIILELLNFVCLIEHFCTQSDEMKQLFSTVLSSCSHQAVSVSQQVFLITRQQTFVAEMSNSKNR